MDTSGNGSQSKINAAAITTNSRRISEVHEMAVEIGKEVRKMQENCIRTTANLPEEMRDAVREELDSYDVRSSETELLQSAGEDDGLWSRKNLTMLLALALGASLGSEGLRALIDLLSMMVTQ